MIGQIFAAILSPAIGVLISPFPIVGLILRLLSDRARTNSIFYMIGWIAGNAIVFSLAMFFMGMGTSSSGEPSLVAKIVSLALGILLILLGVKEFMKRPRKGQEPEVPKWFAKMSKIKPFGAAGFGVILSAANPKNLLLSLGAGAAAGALSLSGGEQTFAVVAYTLIASASIIIPTVAFLLAGHRLDKVLGNVREWLVANNAVIMAVLLLMIGLNILSKSF